MTAIKLHGCSRCTVAIVLRSALSFPHTPYLEQNNLGIFLNIKKNTFECHIDWGFFVSYENMQKINQFNAKKMLIQRFLRL